MTHGICWWCGCSCFSALSFSLDIAPARLPKLTAAQRRGVACRICAASNGGKQQPVAYRSMGRMPCLGGITTCWFKKKNHCDIKIYKDLAWNDWTCVFYSFLILDCPKFESFQIHLAERMVTKANLWTVGLLLGKMVVPSIINPIYTLGIFPFKGLLGGSRVPVRSGWRFFCFSPRRAAIPRALGRKAATRTATRRLALEVAVIVTWLVVSYTPSQN